MIKKLFLLGAIVGLAVGAAAHADAAARTELRGIRLATDSGEPSVVLTLSGRAHYELFTLENPHRVVIDLRDTRLAAGVKPPAASGAIADIRTGVQPKGVLRVVLELREKLAAKETWSGGTRGHELVVRLGGGSRTAASEPELRVVRAAHAPPPDRKVVVAIDPGHGGQDPGAIGHGGTREKDVVLAIARALARRVDAEPGMRAVLTREKDEFLSLRERIRRARAAQADLFVSVHADSIRNREVSGASVYVLSERGASSEAARWLAERENAADLVGGVKLDDKDDVLASVLLDLSQTASISASMTAAERVLAALHEVGEVRKPSVQQAGFVVLKSPDIPSLLIETAYISNPRDERRLRTASHQQKLADAIFSGIYAYFEQNPPAGSLFARARRTGVPGVLAANPSP